LPFRCWSRARGLPSNADRKGQKKKRLNLMVEPLEILSNQKDGGAEGDRTPDLRNAIATLSQLSYGPVPSAP
jgi:hypothetical protein